MATITKRTSSSGEVTFRIKVSLGYDSENRQIIKSMTYRPDKGMTKRQAEKEADRQAVLFEMECREQAEAEEEKGVKPVKFSELAEEYLVMLEETQSQKPSSINRLKSLREKTYEQIENNATPCVRPRWNACDSVFRQGGSLPHFPTVRQAHSDGRGRG